MAEMRGSYVLVNVISLGVSSLEVPARHSLVQGTPEGVEDSGWLTRVAAFPIGIQPEKFVEALESQDVKGSISGLLTRYAGRKVPVPQILPCSLQSSCIIIFSQLEYRKVSDFYSSEASKICRRLVSESKSVVVPCVAMWFPIGTGRDKQPLWKFAVRLGKSVGLLRGEICRSCLAWIAWT